MTYLADACALVVFYGGGTAAQGMSEGMKAMTSGDDVAVLPTTVWEVAREVGLGRLDMPAASSFSNLLRESRFRLMPMSWEDAEYAATLPEHHRDPMDRMLIATALRASMTIITSDRAFQAYGVRTVW